MSFKLAIRFPWNFYVQRHLFNLTMDRVLRLHRILSSTRNFFLLKLFKSYVSFLSFLADYCFLYNGLSFFDFFVFSIVHFHNSLAPRFLDHCSICLTAVLSNRLALNHLHAFSLLPELEKGSRRVKRYFNGLLTKDTSRNLLWRKLSACITTRINFCRLILKVNIFRATEFTAKRFRRTGTRETSIEVHLCGCTSISSILTLRSTEVLRTLTNVVW